MKSRLTCLAIASVISLLVMIAAVVLAAGGYFLRWHPTLGRYQFEEGGVFSVASGRKLVVIYHEVRPVGEPAPKTFRELKARQPHTGHIRFLGIEVGRDIGLLAPSGSGGQMGVVMSSYVMIPYWFIILLSAILPAVWFFRSNKRETRRRKEMGLCLACGYDLRASKDRCPECGTAIEKRQDDGETVRTHS